MPHVILDRDGVINFESKKYIKCPDEWHPIPGSLEAIAKLNQSGFKVLVASNQSGIARGYYDLETLNAIHEKLTKALAEKGGSIEEIFFCPHHPQDNCICRKPKPGMLLQIREKHGVDLSNTYFIGDSFVDFQAARASGCKPLLVLTGNGHAAIQKHSELNDVLHYPDLARAVDYVVSQY